MTAAERAHIRQAIDDRARRLLADTPVVACLFCGDDLPDDDYQARRKFCSPAHRKHYSWSYGRSAEVTA